METTEGNDAGNDARAIQRCDVIAHRQQTNTFRTLQCLQEGSDIIEVGLVAHVHEVLHGVLNGKNVDESTGNIGY